MLWQFRQPAFALVVAWAAWGIYRSQELDYPNVATTAAAAAIICLVGAVLTFGILRKRPPLL
jgi:membrane associated rhomboid family serine protease